MESRPWCLLIAKQHTGHHYGIQSGRRPWVWRCNEKKWVPATVDFRLEGAPRKVATLVDTGMTLQFPTLWNPRNRITTPPAVGMMRVAHIMSHDILVVRPDSNSYGTSQTMEFPLPLPFVRKSKSAG